MLAAALLSVSKAGGWQRSFFFGQESGGNRWGHLLTDSTGWLEGSCPARISARSVPGRFGTRHLVTAMKSHPETGDTLPSVPSLEPEWCCLG